MVAKMAALGAIAIAGNNASPSFDIAFPKSALKGIIPFIKRVVTNIWGPHPGINPIIMARRGIKIPIALNIAFKSRGVRTIGKN